MKIEAVLQQDAVTVEADEDSVALSQSQSWDCQEQRIAIFGKANLDALISALQKAREAMP
ncbi:hypothetical protein [Aquamicrobium sp. LC103]|uniref:hypothetical protein n=1 Tax=Aquamicrobium sp. LC103 TaxID=1120658 RepID=UPI000A854DB4|nr:hypothetical protein [Aquamicrobium sp. LC103]TKT78402.1 hypothetical protein XW59_012360 [Aquamicrobium sp. LC103]